MSCVGCVLRSYNVDDHLEGCRYTAHADDDYLTASTVSCENVTSPTDAGAPTLMVLRYLQRTLNEALPLVDAAHLSRTLPVSLDVLQRLAIYLRASSQPKHVHTMSE